MNTISIDPCNPITIRRTGANRHLTTIMGHTILINPEYIEQERNPQIARRDVLLFHITLRTNKPLEWPTRFSVAMMAVLSDNIHLHIDQAIKLITKVHLS